MHPYKDDTAFNDELKSILQKTRKEKKKNIIHGDFNCSLLYLLYDNNDNVNNFINIMPENNFHTCITEPSRITNANKPSLADNIFLDTFDNPLSGNIPYDHFPK